MNEQMSLTELEPILFTSGGYFKHGIPTRIAERSGVSEQTIANVLRRRQVSVADGTREKVLAAANSVAQEMLELDKLLQ